MLADDLARKLKERVLAAGGKAYPAVHLFGIEFAEELDGHNIAKICALAGLSPNYSTEVSKGRKLAPFVEIKR